MLPFLEVSHLASSASFYSTVTQPLGLRYISAANPPPDATGSSSIVYGTSTSPPVPIFELRQVQPTAARPLKLSRIVFSAASPGAVRNFRALVQRAKGGDYFDDTTALEEAPFGKTTGVEVGQSTRGRDLTETDLDGNIIKMEVVYVPPIQDYPDWHSSSTVRKTQSTQSEASRILQWNYDVASDPASPSGFVSPGRPSLYDERPPLLRRSITTTTTLLEPAEAPQSPSQSSTGLSAVGAALMGVAAGAALGAGITYSVIRGSQDSEAPMAQRRSMFPDPSPESRSRREDSTSIAGRRPPPTVLTRYSHSQAPLPGNRDVGIGQDDACSRHSVRSKTSGAPSARTHSEVSTSRKPLMLTDVDNRSHASSRSSAKTAELEAALAPDRRSYASSRYSSSSRSTKQPPSVRRSKTYNVPEGDSYSCASFQSYRTESTVRGPPAPQSDHASRAASKTAGPAGSRVSTVTPRRADSYVSARQVPLPASGVGSSCADEDLGSIAPSDSISCVGSRRSDRLYD